MPHISAIYVEGFPTENILANNKTKIREALRAQFPWYPMEAITLIPNPITTRSAAVADNLLPLVFVIDVGKQNEQLDESHSNAFCERLIESIPGLNDINFGVWIREMTSNGYSEHTPET